MSTLTWAQDPESRTSLRYYDTQQLCEDILKCIDKCRGLEWRQGFFLKIVKVTLTLSTATWKLNLLEILSYATFMWSYIKIRRPRWLGWKRRPTGDQEVADSTPAEVGNILSWRSIMKYFLRSFSPFRWFKKGSCQFLAKECAQYWLTA